MAEAVGNGVALLAAATAVAGSGDASSASPPPLGKDGAAGVSVGWAGSVEVIATTAAVAVSVLVLTADGSAAELQPASNSATSSHCTMLVVLMISYQTKSSEVRMPKLSG